ncbi:hypothetical protein NBRC10512_004749 [Rhodotorula toruloides]|uniref:RHTO0S03e00628g1_1 n=2 Tax=Rhodotorula toruloides TaxID=5286 RepID=A0A061ARA1_RHOTO|nr:uncharacterized protein RHTO_00064 [Rhodotorula toruloides NP11]EMS25636.1 hypothetical protein RHTO_00064 [Rhodotorula toruloides NP11]CDR37883.1 RHTO0S03e00628g1_1 [Rhodotorula toruloides]
MLSFSRIVRTSMTPFDRLPDELVSHILDSHRAPLSGYWDRAFFACFTVCRRWERLAKELLYRGVVKVESEDDCAALQDLADKEAEQVRRLVFAGEWEGDVEDNVIPYELLEAAAVKLKQLEAVDVRLYSNATGVVPLLPFASLDKLARLSVGSDTALRICAPAGPWSFASLVVLAVNSSTAIEVSGFTPARLPSLRAAYFAEIWSLWPSFDYLGFDRAFLEQLDTLQLLYSPEAEESRIGSCTYLQLEVTVSTLTDRDVAYSRRPDILGDGLAESEATAHLVDQTYPGIRHMRGTMLATGQEAKSFEELRQKMAHFPNLVTFSIPTYLAAFPKACTTHILTLCKHHGVTLLRNSVGDRSDLDYEFWEWVKEEKARAKAAAGPWKS